MLLDYYGIILLCTPWSCESITAEPNGTTNEPISLDKAERSVNLIEQPPKTDNDQKLVHIPLNVTTAPSNTATNQTNDNHDSANTTSTTTTTTERIVKKEKEKSEKIRESNSRSIDIDKYVSPEFQDNEFTLSHYTDTEKYANHFEYGTSSTGRTSSSYEMDLTTPKTAYFDDKFKEAVQKLEQEFEESHDNGEHDTEEEDEHEDARENEDVNDNNDESEDEDEDTQGEKPEEKPKIFPNATVNYKETKNVIMKNNTRGKGVARNNVVVEKVMKVNYVSNFNDTKAYGYKDQTTEAPRSTVPTTRKGTTLTKPPVDQNNSHILSNKIETETIKALNIGTTPVPSSTKSMTKESLRDLTMAPDTITSTEKLSTTTYYEASNEPESTVHSSEITTSTEDMTTTSVQSTENWDRTSSETPEFTTIFLAHEYPRDDYTSTELTESTEEPMGSSTVAIYDTTVTSSEEHMVEVTEKMIPVDFTPDDELVNMTTTTFDDLTTTEHVVEHQHPSTVETTVTHIVQDDSTTGPQHVEGSSSEVPVTTAAGTTTLSHQNQSSFPGVEQIPRNYDGTDVPSSPTTEHELTEASIGTESSVTPSYSDDINQGRVAAIVISSVGAVCLILLATLLYVIRKRQNKFNYKQRCRPVGLDDYSVDNLSVYNSVRRKGLYRQSKRSYGNPAFDDHEVTTHPLNFPALAKFATNTVDMKAEFEDIPQITAKTSELPEGCETKNRYANVIPLPETRVYLNAIDGQPNSDYINANYVTGYKGIKSFYIACQAPMQNTVDDFWRMIWEQQVKVVLMITHLFENGVEKCVDYLPPSEVLDCHRVFGDFQITLKKRDVKDKYIISSLQLKNMVSNSWREVTHFWYLGWPDKGVPSEANSLIAFLIEARSYMKTSTLDKNSSAAGLSGQPQNEVNPVVVHCSPGTGRTGVAIACDIAIREFEQTRLVDVPKTVYRIRRDRANSVQTKEQYMFIYKVVSLYATKLTGGVLDPI
ncbi:unnamed protein product [Acanthoscelides obtectus]|uniref:Uncharacterized protein n=1 Tax=Acanthoscelides obtectus TaxID=200917 RepID=A0A9P0KMR0_ACAOB|nr:unnamed protein product [Acanthoscelides obtectus]CAK1653758.1 Tyrosine-protein phosphatase non-receptor type 7 [Acanthoscelides obtectus]